MVTSLCTAACLTDSKPVENRYENDCQWQNPHSSTRLTQGSAVPAAGPVIRESSNGIANVINCQRPTIGKSDHGAGRSPSEEGVGPTKSRFASNQQRGRRGACRLTFPSIQTAVDLFNSSKTGHHPGQSHQPMRDSSRKIKAIPHELTHRPNRFARRGLNIVNTVGPSVQSP